MNKKLFLVFALLATLQSIAAVDCTATGGTNPCTAGGTTPYCDLSLTAGSRVCVAASACSTSVSYGDPSTGTCVASTACPTANAYQDTTNKVCVTATGCPTGAPFSDSGVTPKACVAAASCSTGLPWGDPTATVKACVAAGACNAANPYQNTASNTCVTAANCATNTYGDGSVTPKACVTTCGTTVPYGDPTSKTCVVATGCDSTANPFGDSTLTPKKCVAALSCSTAVSWGDLNTKTCVASCPTGSTGDSTTKVCPLTAVVASTASAGSAFNVTPALVYTTTDTSAPAFTAVANGAPTFGPGSDSTSAYVWLTISPSTSTGTYVVNRRTVNTSGTFAKSNTTADVAITTAVPYGASILKKAGPGGFAIASYVAGINFGSATATASEITLHIMTGSSSSATAKALTGNTNTGVFFALQDMWFLNGTIYVAYTMKTRTQGTATAVDTYALNGLYIQGVNATSGALVYNTTGGVKMLALTQSNSGTTMSTTACVCTTSCSGCASSSFSQDASFQVGIMNWTVTDTVQYLWTDQSTSTAQTIKAGTINVTTGAATSGNTLATWTSASTPASGCTATAPCVTTSYSTSGFLGSFGTYGSILYKTVSSDTGLTNGVTNVYTWQAFINGSTTAVSNMTVASGYKPSTAYGFHTADGFVMVETQTATTTPTNGQGRLIQAERYFTNGSASGTAVSLGTYGNSDVQNAYQDTNGSIILGYALRDSNTGNTYSGYMGTYIAQQLAASTLSSVFAFLSLMIVALFAF